MNYLAHIFLSGSNRKIQFGNFIADAVKGQSYKNYPRDIANGILLHRAIDDFTDRHPAVRKAISALKPGFGRYSGVLLDMYFDYLLASRFTSFSDIPLKRYARRFYWTLIFHYPSLPARFKRFVWHFIFTDRLGKYALPQGLQEALDIMVEYHRMDISVDKAMQYLEENSDDLSAVFDPFFAELQVFSKEYIREICSGG